jgi:hypothetical protein
LPKGVGPVLASFAISDADFEVAANIAARGGGEYGILLLGGGSERVGRLSTTSDTQNMLFEIAGKKLEIEPQDIDRGDFRQFRILCRDGKATAYLDGVELGELEQTVVIAKAAIFADGEIAVDMVRLTDISAR